MSEHPAPDLPARARDRRFEGLPVRTLPGGLAVIEAETHRSRRRGLSRLDALDPDDGLHIPATPSIHMFGMRFALDLIWLDGDGAIVRVDYDVQPRRFRTCTRARSVIEVNAGRADAFVAAGVGAAVAVDGTESGTAQ
jgi:hypothetical protein